MDYSYHEKKVGSKSDNILDDMQAVSKSNCNNLHYMAELLALTKMAGLNELEGYLSHSIQELEKSELWIKAAISLLENEW